MKRILCSILFFLNTFFAFTENMELENRTNELKYILSLDTRYTITALKNSGFGIGVSHEHKLTNFLSMKYIFGQMVCFLDTTVLTIDQQLFLYYYPLGNGFDKLYHCCQV